MAKVICLPGHKSCKKSAVCHGRVPLRAIRESFELGHGAIPGLMNFFLRAASIGLSYKRINGTPGPQVGEVVGGTRLAVSPYLILATWCFRRCLGSSYVVSIAVIGKSARNEFAITAISTTED